MNEQHDARPEGSQLHTIPQGFQMFKDHIAAMKQGSKLLGGERESVDQRGVSGAEDK